MLWPVMEQRETSGYSIKVNDVYTGDNALYIDLNLIGPAAGKL